MEINSFFCVCMKLYVQYFNIFYNCVLNFMFECGISECILSVIVSDYNNGFIKNVLNQILKSHCFG